MRRKYGLKTRLHRVSHSFLAAATACPLRGFWEGIVEIPVPQSPPAVLGQAMHYMFQQFYSQHPTTKRYPYQEEAKLQGAFKHFWWGAVNGRHGFSGRGTAPRDVAWQSADQAGQFYGRGAAYLRNFFARANPTRQDQMIHYRLVERRATVNWQGLIVTSVFDRLDVGLFLTADEQVLPGACVVDYKPSEFPDHQLAEGTQFSIYQWLYETAVRPSLPGMPPLLQMQVHNYGRDQISDVPLRDPVIFDELRRLMGQVTGYYLKIISNQPVSEIYPFFDQADLERRTISPKLPRGQHCQYCGHVASCQRYVRMSPAEQYSLMRQQLSQRFGRQPDDQQSDLGLPVEHLYPGVAAITYEQLQRRQGAPQLVLEV
ncbi:MAG: PD-(D/E)XK nuclease family protein [Candidatus Komeilibacteria bacterium]